MGLTDSAQPATGVSAARGPTPVEVPAAAPQGRERPIAFAHRGASGYAADNSMEAFDLALRQGATGLESDVWLAADGVPVLAHDRTIRVNGRRIDVTRRGSGELRHIGVPALAELYAELGTGFELSLDVEHQPVALPMLAVAEEAGAADRLWACHPDPSFLAALGARSPRVRLVCSTRPRRIPGGLGPLAALLPDAGVHALNMHWRDWSPARRDLARGAGLLVFAWDAQDESSMDRALGLGVDAIYSDYPDRLVSAIARSMAAELATTATEPGPSGAGVVQGLEAGPASAGRRARKHIRTRRPR